MTMIRVSYRRPDGEHTGYSFHADAAEAQAAIDALKELMETEMETCEFGPHPSKTTIIYLLNRYGSHPDNG